MTEHQGYAVLYLIAVFAAQVNHDETTRKFNKLRNQIRKGVTKTYSTKPEFSKAVGQLSDRAFEKSKEYVGKEGLTINIEQSLLSLYALIDGTKYANMWFSEKTLFSAVQSLDVKFNNGRVDAELNSSGLVKIFAEALGINRNNRLAVRKKVIETNLILDGRVA